MSLSFVQSLETSRVLQERLSSAPLGEKHAALEQATAQADFATFGMFKEALGVGPMGPMLSAAGKGLGWGAGLGVPALGVGHMLARDAREQTEKTIDHARNQALLTALGVGGMQGVGQAISGALKPRGASPALPEAPQAYEQSMARPGLDVNELASLRGLPIGDEGFEDYPGFKTSSDVVLRKLAAVVLLDDVLEQQVTKLAGVERDDTIECLFLNRSHGASLLRELF